MKGRMPFRSSQAEGTMHAAGRRQLRASLLREQRKQSGDSRTQSEKVRVGAEGRFC